MWYHPFYRYTLVMLWISWAGVTVGQQAASPEGWDIFALPSSVRMDPSTGKILEDRPDLYTMDALGDLRKNNWVYDGQSVQLRAARGEYVSVQLVIQKTGKEDLKDVVVEMSPFTRADDTLPVSAELFLEWAVEVTAPSTGYPQTSLGPAYYPDALIPLRLLQMDRRLYPGRLHYPFELPDFINRIKNQQYAIIWIDQWIPRGRSQAPPGKYQATITVSVSGQSRSMPVQLDVWDFALPNENTLAGNLQHEGFLKRMDEELELQVYQLFKRHRVVPADPTYDPTVTVSADGEVQIDFDIYDQRLKKYFTGEAFTTKHGYPYGPGYGEPLEQFVLPFDVYGKHGSGGWPDIVKRELTPTDHWMDAYQEAAQWEQVAAKKKIYLEAIHLVRSHLLQMVDPQKTDLIVYLNGLDESYFPEAWDRMKYWGTLFKEAFPESKFRVDGSYSDEAMTVIKDAIDYWCCHTIGYDIDTIEKYRAYGVVDWLYGPQMYEGPQNGWCGSSTFLDLELSNERLISWSCFKYSTHTWCSWGIGSGWATGWYNSETFKDIFRDHGTGPPSYRSYNGNAMTIYAPGYIPGVHEPCPSIRLKNMRDGVEEYEYMQMLSELDGHRGRVEEIVNRVVYRPYGSAAIGDLEAWNHHPRAWDEARWQLGQLIDAAVD